MIPAPEDDLDWRQRAACRDEDPNRMQPEVATRDELDEAMALCAGCPVRRECRELAESHLGAYGIHAGRWYGPLPEGAPTCAWCAGPMPAPKEGAGRPGVYCGTRCRVAALRARQAVSA